MMSSGSFYTKMSDKVVPYLAAKLSHKRTTGEAKSSNYKRVVDDLKNQMVMMMMSNNSGNKKCRTWRKLGSPSSAASTIFSVFGTGNKVNGTGEIKTRFRVVKAKNSILGGAGGGQVGVLRWFKKGDDHKADSVGMTVKRSSKVTNVFRRVADSRKLRLVERISARKLVKRERKGLELCKRRILMGVKCKPVNASGKLHYGRDGVLLAEDQA